MYIELPEELKEIIRKRNVEEPRRGVEYEDEQCFIVAAMILAYLKEFRDVKTEKEFKSETERLWIGFRPIGACHPIREDVYGREGASKTKTFEIMNDERFLCMDETLCKYMAQTLRIYPDVWKAVKEMYEEDTSN
jgi:hypothetical protein